MEKEAIANLLEEKHNNFITWLQNQPDRYWEQGPDGKWTTGQHAMHIIQSLKPLNKALSLPKFLLRYKFGKTNRALRDYATVIKRYQERLKDVKGITFKGSQNMKAPNINDKSFILDKIQVEQKKLQYKTLKLSDKALDSLVLPHPLMGKMPIRELIMWTAYHVEHHNATLDAKYNFTD